MKTTGKKWKASIAHHDELIKELRADRQLAVEYLKAALSELDDPDNRAAGLLAMRRSLWRTGCGCPGSMHKP